jgi:hypothetical protein
MGGGKAFGAMFKCIVEFAHLATAAVSTMTNFKVMVGVTTFGQHGHANKFLCFI